MKRILLFRLQNGKLFKTQIFISIASLICEKRLEDDIENIATEKNVDKVITEENVDETVTKKNIVLVTRLIREEELEESVVVAVTKENVATTHCL